MWKPTVYVRYGSWNTANAVRFWMGKIWYRETEKGRERLKIEAKK